MSRLWWHVIRLIARLCTWAYYRAFRVEGIDRVPTSGPVLFIANHPNSLVDAGAVLRAVPRPISFAAKSTLFSVPVVGWMLRKLGAVPVYRPRDRSGPLRENLKMFAAFTDLFKAGGATVIYPEGHSHVDPELREVKSGPARIALDAEAACDFELGLQIVPLGLHYEPRQEFRGEIDVRIGEPFGVADLKDQPRRVAIRTAQERITESLRPLLLHLDQVELEPLVRGVADVYAEHQRAHPSALEPRSKTEIVQTAGACLNYYLRADPEVVDIAARKLDRYERIARRAGAGAEALAGRARPVRNWFSFLRMLLGLVLGFPLYVVGCLTSYVPYRLTDSTARHKAEAAVDLPIRRIGAGAIWFGIFWGILCLLVFLWSRSFTFTAFFFGALLVCAFVARYYAERGVVWRERLAGMMPWAASGLDRVEAARSDLLGFVNELARRYQSETGASFLPARKRKWHQRVPWRTLAGGTLLALISWFAWGLKDSPIEELPRTPSPWTTMTPEAAAYRLEAHGREMASILDTLEHLEARMDQLRAAFRSGQKDRHDPRADDEIRAALLSYLHCRGRLFRMIWWYREPARPDPVQAERAFLISYVAGIELCRRGIQLIRTFEDHDVSVAKLNEGDAAWQIPAGSFDRIRRNLANTKVYRELASATARFRDTAASDADTGIWRRLREHASMGEAVLGRLAEERWDFKWDAAVARLVGSAEEGRYALSRFFAVAIGNVRVREGDVTDGLISDRQVAWLQREKLQPGDILLQRRNWALSNVFLPGFWTHAALYVGGPAGVSALGIGGDERVRAHLDAIATPDGSGRPRVILEALGEGVILNSLETSVGEADAVCVLRPRLPPGQISDAMARAIRQHGKPYDFDFDFATTDKLVCTELIHHAYQGPLRFELQSIMGRKTLPAIEILRKWSAERGTPAAQLEAVCFLDSVESEGLAREGDDEQLLATLERPGMTLLQDHGGSSEKPRAFLIVLGVLALAALVFVRRPSWSRSR